MHFIEQHKCRFGKFRSAAGYPVTIDYENTDPTKIVGTVLFPTSTRRVEWDLTGVPLELPINQCLNLVPLREVISYETIPKSEWTS